MKEDNRVYQIPRKVDAGLRFYGLNIMGLLIMFVPLGLSIGLWMFTNIETFGKIAISVMLVYGTYLMLTVDLNGQTGFEFVALLIKHMQSQKVYSLTSSKDFTDPEPEERHLIRLRTATRMGEAIDGDGSIRLEKLQK